MLKFAHRGASGHAPENTLAAMKKAVAAGFKAVEFDVQLSKDNEVVVIHDYKLERTTDMKGYVMRKNLSELKKADIGSWYGEEYRGERIQTLEEVIEFLPDDMLLNIEIKSFVLDMRDVAKRVMEIVDRYGIGDRVIISSFDHKILKKVRRYSQDVRIGLLFYGKMMDLKKYPLLNEINPYSLHLSADYLDPEELRELRDLPYKIYSYTINDREFAERFHEEGLDGYFTDLIK